MLWRDMYNFQELTGRESFGNAEIISKEDKIARSLTNTTANY
jgi:hypothetical protein